MYVTVTSVKDLSLEHNGDDAVLSNHLYYSERDQMLSIQLNHPVELMLATKANRENIIGRWKR